MTETDFRATISSYNALNKQQIAKPGVTAAQKTAWEGLRIWLEEHRARISTAIRTAIR